MKKIKGNKKYCIFLLENLDPQVWGVVHQCPSLQEALRSAGSSGEGGCAHCPGCMAKIVLGILDLASSGPQSPVTWGVWPSEGWLADWMNMGWVRSWPAGMVTCWIW